MVLDVSITLAFAVTQLLSTGRQDFLVFSYSVLQARGLVVREGGGGHVILPPTPRHASDCPPLCNILFDWIFVYIFLEKNGGKFI